MFRHKLQKAVARSLIAFLCMQSIVPVTVHASAVVKEQSDIIIQENETVSVAVEENERKAYLFTPDSNDRYLFYFQDNTDEIMRVKVTDGNGLKLEDDFYYSEENNGLSYAAYDLSAGEPYRIEIYGVEEYGFDTTLTIEKSKVDSLELLALPDNRIYRKGNFTSISYYGLQVQVNYKDGREPELMELEYDTNGVNIGIDEKASEEPWYEVAGEHPVSVRYQGAKAVFTIEVVTGNDIHQEISLGERVSYKVNNRNHAYFSFTSEEAGVYLLSQPTQGQAEVRIQKQENGYFEEIYNTNYPNSMYYESGRSVQIFNLEENSRYTIEVSGYSSEEIEDTLVIGKTNVKKIEVESLPDKVEYYKWSSPEIELSGLKLQVEYTDGDSEIISYEYGQGFGYKDICESNLDEEHEWYFTDYEGEHLIGVQYRGITTQFSVTVVEDPVSKVSIRTNPDKTVYYKDYDRAIELDGLELNISMKDGSTQVVTADNDKLQFIGVYLSEEDIQNGDETSDWFDYEGEYLVAVRYQERQVTYTITVENPNITDIKMTSLPHKMNYTQFVDDNLDFTGIEFEFYQDENVFAVVTEDAIQGYSISPSDWYEKEGSYSVNLTVGNQDFILDGITVDSIESEFQNVTDTLQVNDEIEVALEEINGFKIYQLTPSETADYMLRIHFESEFNPYPAPYLLDQKSNKLGETIGNDRDELCYARLEKGQTYYYVVRAPKTDETEWETVYISFVEGKIESLEYVNESSIDQMIQSPYRELSLYNKRFLITNTDGSSLEFEYQYANKIDWEFTTNVKAGWSNIPGRYRVKVTFMNQTAFYAFEVISLQSCAEAMDTLVTGEPYNSEYEENASESYIKFVPDTTGIYEIRTNGLSGNLGDVIDSSGKDVIQMSAWTEFGDTSIILELEQGNQYYIRKTNEDYSIRIDRFDTSTVQSIESMDGSVTHDYLQYRDTKLSNFAFYFNVAIEGEENREYRLSQTFEGTMSTDNWYNVPGTHTVSWNLLGQQAEREIHVIEARSRFDSAIEIKEGVPAESVMQEYKWEGYFYQFTPETTGYYKSEVDNGKSFVQGWFFDEDGQLLAMNDVYAVAKLEKGKNYYINIQRIENDNDYTLTLTKLEDSELEDAGYCFDESENYKVTAVAEQSYTGTEVKPELELTKNGICLVENEDYLVRYYDNVAVGKARAIIQIYSVHQYTTTIVKTFDITETVKELGEALLEQIDYVYTGSAIAPKPIVKDSSDAVLTENEDYTLVYSTDLINIGQKTVTVTGKGSYTGSMKLSYTIKQAQLTDTAISNIAAQVYTGKAIKPAVTIKNGKTVLKAGTDYVTAYTGNVSKGTATVTITGKGNYTGTAKKMFAIHAKPMSQLTISNIAAQTYTGKAIKPAIFVKNGTIVLKAGTDYVAVYTGNVAKGKAAITITGKGNYTGTVKKTFVINGKSVSRLTVNKISNAVYTGREIKPGVTVKNGSVTLRSSKDYKVSYKNNKNIGDATIIITGTGNYTGTKTIRFTITPKKLASVKATSKKTKKIDVSWSKDTKVSGYEIIYATDSKQTKNRKVVDVKKNSTASYSLEKLTKNKKYYVSVRSYKMVNGKKVYGASSKIITVKCK